MQQSRNQTLTADYADERGKIKLICAKKHDLKAPRSTKEVSAVRDEENLRQHDKNFMDSNTAAPGCVFIIVKIKSIPGEGIFGQSQLRPQSQFAFSDRQKAFFKVLRFAAHWPSAEWN